MKKQCKQRSFKSIKKSSELNNLSSCYTQISLENIKTCIYNNIDNIPDHVTYLNCGYNFNNDINIQSAKSELKILILGQYFASKIIKLPPSIRSLYISSNNYNNDICNIIGISKLQCLHIETKYFSKSIDYLPHTLNEFYLSNTNDINITGKSIDKLPVTLYSFKYCPYRNDNMTNLPIFLKKLQFTIDHQICWQNLPPYLYLLDITNRLEPISYNNIPNNIEILSIFNAKSLKLANLPYKLRELDLGICLIENLDVFNKNKIHNPYPNPYLHKLTICKWQNNDLIQIPISIDTIIITDYLDELPLLPPHITTVIFMNCHVNIDNLSDTIEHIIIDNSYDYLITKLPANIISIKFVEKYNYIDELFLLFGSMIDIMGIRN